MFDFLKPKIVVATHDGRFHADEVFGCAALSLWAEKNNKRIQIIRTRDPEKIKKAHIVLDVGMEYVPDKNLYDHHQAEGAGAHKNGIPYASFGLIWKHFGEKITSKEAVEMIENRLVSPIDAADNGINISNFEKFGFSNYTLDDAMEAVGLSSNDKNFDTSFATGVQFAKTVLIGEINKANFKIESREIVRKAIEEQAGSPILILDKYASWQESVSPHKQIQLIVHKHRNGHDWCIQTVLENPEDYSSYRLVMPEAWRGLREGDLEKVSEIPGAIFCTSGGWFAVASSKEAAISLAKKALALAEAGTSA